MVTCSLIPFFGHLLIFLIPFESEGSIFVDTLLVIGLSMFGMGLGSYYSVSFPAIGYAVPKNIRGIFDITQEAHMLVYAFFRQSQ